jgi:hypothetical protein
MKFPNGSKDREHALPEATTRTSKGWPSSCRIEAVDAEDWSMRGMMASLGIEKGKPFRAG